MGTSPSRLPTPAERALIQRLTEQRDRLVAEQAAAVKVRDLLRTHLKRRRREDRRRMRRAFWRGFSRWGW